MPKRWACGHPRGIVRTVERHRGEAWAQFADRYGDWGRDLALYLARRRSGLTLRQIGDALGGLDSGVNVRLEAARELSHNFPDDPALAQALKEAEARGKK